MGHEGFASRDENRKKSPEKNAVVIRTTDKVLRELLKQRPLDDLSREAKHVLERILRENNRGRKTVVSGQTTAMAVWIHEIRFGHAEVR